MTFGVHPRVGCVYIGGDSPNLHAQLRHFTKVRGLVAIGECGLDYTGTNNDTSRRRQEELFQFQLDLARDEELPVIIHCRDKGSGQAAAKCLQMMRATLKREHRIHRHCFTGPLEEAQEWMSHFPNCVFSLSPLILQQQSGQMEEMIRGLPLEKIVLETDAPYLSPPSLASAGPTPTPSPFLLPLVAKRAATVRGISEATVLRITAMTAIRLYGLQ